MTMQVFYLGHSEQLSIDTFQYIDCGTNSTVPHKTWETFNSTVCEAKKKKLLLMAGLSIGY